MDTVLMDQVVDTDFGQFDLVWVEGGGFDGNFDRFFAGQVNGLVGAATPEGLYLNLARRSGGSSVRIVLGDAPPGIAGPLWEDIVEVSICIPAGQEPHWWGWAGMSGRDLACGQRGCRILAPGSGRPPVTRLESHARKHGETFLKSRAAAL